MLAAQTGRTRGPAPYYAYPPEIADSRAKPESGLRTRGAEKTPRPGSRDGNRRQVRRETIYNANVGDQVQLRQSCYNYGIRYRGGVDAHDVCFSEIKNIFVREKLKGSQIYI